MTYKDGKNLTLSEVKVVLRWAAERAGHRKKSGASEMASVSPELLVEVASALGIPEPDVRLALSDLSSAKAFEPDILVQCLRLHPEGNATLNPHPEHSQKLGLHLERSPKLRRTRTPCRRLM